MRNMQGAVEGQVPLHIQIEPTLDYDEAVIMRSSLCEGERQMPYSGGDDADLVKSADHSLPKMLCLTDAHAVS